MAFLFDLISKTLFYICLLQSARIPEGGGGGGTQVQRGAAAALRISRDESFLRPPHVRDFVKEVLFCTQVRSMGV